MLTVNLLVCAHAHVRCMCFCMLTGIEGFNFEFDRGCVYVYTFNSSPYSHIHFLQPVLFPLSHCLYVCIVSGFQAPLNWLIKSEHVPPAQCFLSITFSLCFPLHHSPRPMSVYVWVCVCVCECVHVCVCVCANVCVRGCVRLYHIIGLDIKASYLQRVSQGFSGNLERTWYRCISQIISPLGYTGLKGKRSRGHESYA